MDFSPGLNPRNVFITVRDVENIFRTVGVNDLTVSSLSFYQRAFVHKSYCSKFKKNKIQDSGFVPFQDRSNERDEYFGDGLLGVMVGLYLFERFEDEDEGFLTKMRTKIVNGKTLSELASKLSLQKYILISKQVEDSCEGRNLSSLLENTLEAFISAVYHDQRARALELFKAASVGAGEGNRAGTDLFLRNPNGYAFGRVYDFVTRMIERFVDFSSLVVTENNYKDILLKHFQKTYKSSPIFREVSLNGPPHRRIFTISVHHITGEELGRGSGATKRDAQQEAAMHALTALGIEAKYI